MPLEFYEIASLATSDRVELGPLFRDNNAGRLVVKYADDLVSQPPKLVGEELRLNMMTEKRGKLVVAVHLTSMAETVYPSQSDAARKLGMTVSDISAVLRGKQHSSKGYWFRDADRPDKKIPSLVGSEAARAKRDIAVWAFNLKTGEKTQHRNTTVAAEYAGTHKSDASNILRGKLKSSNNYFFAYEENPKLPVKIDHQIVAEKSSKPVIAVRLSDNAERWFSSAKQAAEWSGVHSSAISMVLSGRIKASKGFTFRRP